MGDIEQDLASKRERLVDRLVRQGVLESPLCIRAMRTVKRELFVDEGYKEYAYQDSPLPLGDTGQTISAPHMCAYMLEALDLQVGLEVLEIGSGSGYHAALVAECVAPSDEPRERWGNVITIEVVERLYEIAKRNLDEAGYLDRVTPLHGDGSLGVPPGDGRELHDRILVTAAAPEVPTPLKEQLKRGGVFVIPVGSRFMQRLQKYEKDEEGEFRKTSMLECAFVPLVGKFGW